MTELSSYKFAGIVARFLDNKQAKDISILDISKISVLADYFVICSADTTTQVRSMTEGIVELIKKRYERTPIGKEQDVKNRWNLLDYGDVIVHIMHSEERELYTIEKFWNHACKIAEDDWLRETSDIADELR